MAFDINSGKEEKNPNLSSFCKKISGYIRTIASNQVELILEKN